MRFESEDDLTRERIVMEKFAMGFPFVKLGDYDLDFMIDGRCYVEVKCLNSTSTQYKVQIISLIKLVKMQEKAKILPVFIVFGYIDGIRYIKFDDITGFVKQSGRKPRPGATNDTELLLHLDRQNLKTLKQQ